jgi:DNA-binding response OmpR family regulator
MGLKGSSPAIDRHRGFADALKEYPQIHVVASLQGDWTEKSAVEAIKNYRGDLSQVDFVFGQNDRMAVGASKVLSEKYPSSSILYCGIDGLPGKGNGVECVRDSILEASYIYPTRGDEVLQLAMNILEGKPYKKENLLMAAMVTRDNAHVVLMQSEEAVRQAKYLDRLHDKIDETLQVLGTQKVYVISLIVVIVLLAVTFILLYLYFLQRSRIREEREQMARSQLDFYTKASHQLRTPLTLISGPVEKLKNLLDTQSSSEASTLIHIVDRNTQELEKLVNDILQGGEQNDQLPMVDEISDVETFASLPSEDDSGEPVSILIVDDNDDIRTYLRTILQERYQVEEAADGQLGLEKARQTVPDLIISDVMTPVMNGLEFCQKVKTEVTTSHIPVILLTARALYQHQIEGYRHGADAYITKPFQSSLLLARIDNLLRNRHLLRNIWSSQDIEKKEHRATPQQDSRENAFIEKFRMVVEAKMADSNLGVEEIASDMNLSRVQLYRKVKALTGSSPVELMRKARLSKAYRLLLSGDKNISEVAYEVGFSAPSYFTKCFKDEFGVLPGDVRSRM